MTLDELKQRQQELIERMHDPDFNKDASENSNRDTVLTEHRTISEMIAEMERKATQGSQISLPGTIAIAEVYTLKYIKVVKNGKLLELPKSIRFKLTDKYCAPDIFADISQVIEISASSPIGETLLNHLPGFFRFNTPYGYSEVEVTT